MERLTKEQLDNLRGLYEERFNTTPMDSAIHNALEELAEYRRLEKRGKLLRLPCKVGDTVYVIPSRVNCALNRLNGHSENNRVYVQRVHSIQMYSNDRYLLTTCDGLQSVLSDYYKETWFLTKREAEAALEKVKGE